MMRFGLPLNSVVMSFEVRASLYRPLTSFRALGIAVSSSRKRKRALRGPGTLGRLLHEPLHMLEANPATHRVQDIALRVQQFAAQILERLPPFEVGPPQLDRQ